MDELSTSGRSTPKVSTRRLPRFSPRTTAFKPTKVERPPIILEWGSTVVRVGYAERFQPQHILPLPQEPKYNQEENGNKTTTTASQWYDYVSPLVRKLFDLLMVDPAVHKLICVTRPYPQRAWEEAFQYALWNVGVPAYSITSFLDAVPMALGWLRGMVIHVGMEEAHCLCHVDGHPLHFTYQVVPCGYQKVVKGQKESTTADPVKVRCKWDENMYNAWLGENHPHSLLIAIMKCIEACPRDARKDVISNLVFCGETLLIVPDLPKQIASRFKRILKRNESDEKQKKVDNKEKEEASDDENKENTGKTSKASLDALTSIPVSSKSLLKPLADHIGLISCYPYRPDLISWVGASIWSTVWHRRDNKDVNENTKIQWVLSPAAKQQALSEY